VTQDSSSANALPRSANANNKKKLDSKIPPFFIGSLLLLIVIVITAANEVAHYITKESPC
jgi:hypothetical protein